MASRRPPPPDGNSSIERINVLLVDDEADSLFPVLVQHLNSLGFELIKESDAARALTTIEASIPDVVLLDLHFPGDERRSDGRTAGGAILTDIRQKFESVPVVVFTTRLDDIDTPLETFDEQPHGYFAKPNFADDAGWPERLAQAMRDAIYTARSAQVPHEDDLGFYVGETKEMREVAARIRTAARNSLAVLIYGEAGSGKRLAAEAIHNLSNRTGRFEHYNCAGARTEMLDSTLFGHVRGISPGARETNPGLIELADNGTLFLDELHDIPAPVQDRLLTLIENKTLKPMEGKSAKKVDVRLIVATNHNLSDLVADGVLREDLAYHLGALLVFLPPLRDRTIDLPELVKIFVAKANSAANRNVLPIVRPETQRKLEEHRWSGNVRELEATILRAVAQTSSNILLPADIEFVSIARTREIEHASGSSVLSTAALALTLADHLESLKKGERYAFLKGLTRDLQKALVIEFVCRLRGRTGKRVTHKALAFELDFLDNTERDLNKIRQFLHACGVRLTQLDYNQ
jgi:DNA-binding NtrC family response regulator